MSRDHVQEALIEALQQALAEPGEQRLYRAGKLTGLFPSRGGVSGEAAARAVRDGLLEVVRTEIKGKTATEWVRVTPRGIDFLHEHESPVQVLRELRDVLHQWTFHLVSLSQRVEESLQRLAPPPPDGVASVPWAADALAYLDRRRTSGAPGDCPLPELFAALRDQVAELSVPAFHDGLRRLHDRQALRLLPFTGPTEQMPEPEYALVNGLDLLYYAAR